MLLRNHRLLLSSRCAGSVLNASSRCRRVVVVGTPTLYGRPLGRIQLKSKVGAFPTSINPSFQLDQHRSIFTQAVLNLMI